MTRPQSVDALVHGRSCGPCTACCRILEIEVLAKPAGTLCPHNSGIGCTIYAERPDACARWHCLWRKIGALPDALRPDRSGVVFALERSSPDAEARQGACIVGRAVEDEQAFERWEATEAFAMFIREGSLPVWKATAQAATLMDAGRHAEHR